MWLRAKTGAMVSRPPNLSVAEWIAVLGLFSVGIAYQLGFPLIDDVSWLLVVDEKILAGKQLYVDIIEVNPPMSAFLYMPAVVLGHLTGIAAESWQLLITLGVIAGGIAIAAAILRGATDARVGAWVVAATVALVDLPAAAFSQREHLALALMLPILALYVARLQDAKISGAVRILAGLAAGLAICIKPHFALALLIPAVFVAWKQTSIRPLLGIEHWLAALVVLVYAAVVVLFFPAYLTDMVPMLADTYRRVRQPLTSVTFALPLGIASMAGLGTVFGVGPLGLSTRSRILLLAAAGFLLGYVEQGKGWPYHLYPTYALVALVLLDETLPRLARALGLPWAVAPGAAQFRAGMVVALVAIAALFPIMQLKDWSSLPLVATIRQIAPHPRVLALSNQLSVGHPLTRLVDGDWVGSTGHRFLTANATWVLAHSTDPAVNARMQGWIKRDRELLADDLDRGRPDILLIDHKTFDLDALMESGSEAARLIQRYQRITTVDDIDLLVPREQVAAATVAMDARRR